VVCKKPWLFGFGTEATAEPDVNPRRGPRFRPAKAEFHPNPPPKAVAFGFETKTNGLALSWPRILESQSHG
jgi:hypothetical protein